MEIRHPIELDTADCDWNQKNMTVKVSTFLDVRASIFCMIEFVFEHVQFAGVWDPTQLPGQSAFDTDLLKLAFLLS